MPCQSIIYSILYKCEGKGNELRADQTKLLRFFQKRFKHKIIKRAW